MVSRSIRPSGETSPALASILRAEPGIHRLMPQSRRWQLALAHRLIDARKLAEARTVIESVASMHEDALADDEEGIEPAFIRARLLESEQRHAEALRVFRDLDHGQIRSELFLMLAGRCAFRTGDFETAAACYRRAIAIRPSHDAWGSLAATLPHLGRFDEARTACERALRFDPRSELAHQNLGWIQSLTGDFAGEMRTLGRREKLSVDPAGSRMSLGMARLRLGDFARGWIEYEARLASKPLAIVPEEFAGLPRWDGVEPLEGKRLLVFGEQGVGDNVMMMRYFPLLKRRGAHIVYVCQPEIHGIVDPALGVDEICSRNERPPVERADLWIPVMSLPLAFGTTVDSIPSRGAYLAPQAEDLAYWRELVGDTGGALKVGVAWAGNPSHKADALRSIPFERFLPLLQTSGVRFFSVQLQAAPLGAAAAPSLREFSSELLTFADTAALLANLDLVITVDSSGAHLAAALGRPTWILVPFPPEWRWMVDREDSPWYDSVRIFRQREPWKWDPVIEAVRVALGRLAEARNAS